MGGFRLPTDIQAESIPLILGGGDVLMVSVLIICSVFVFLKYSLMMVCSPLLQAAETGSGKTGVSTL